MSGSGTSTVYAGGGKRQGGSNSLQIPAGLLNYPQSGAINTTSFAEPIFMAAESGISSILQFGGVSTNTSHYVASTALFVGPLLLGRVRVKAVPNGKFYSVAYETTLPENLYPGVNASKHLTYANKSMLSTLDDATLKSLDIVMKTKPNGSAITRRFIFTNWRESLEAWTTWCKYRN